MAGGTAGAADKGVHNGLPFAAAAVGYLEIVSSACFLQKKQTLEKETEKGELRGVGANYHAHLKSLGQLSKLHTLHESNTQPRPLESWNVLLHLRSAPMRLPALVLSEVLQCCLPRTSYPSVSLSFVLVLIFPPHLSLSFSHSLSR